MFQRIYITDASKSEIIRDHVSEKTHSNLSAFEVVVIGMIPKNTSDKTLYLEL